MEGLEVEDHSSSSTVSDLLRSASALAIPTLDLNRRGLRDIPTDFPTCNNLECLYLEGNSLKSLPDTLFLKCPSLRWLDLRNNSLSTIPPGIGDLRNLKTLLLEGNKITSLPPQLGLLYKLNGLSLCGNPLQSPPPSVVQEGTQAVLHYLRDLMTNEVGGTSEETSEDDNGDDNVYLEPVPTKRSLLHYSSSGRSTERGLFLRQATLHSSINQQKLRQEQFASLLSSMDSLKNSRRIKSRKQQRRKQQQWPLKQELDLVEKERITETLEREKSKVCLDKWREETKQRKEEKASSPPMIIVPQPPFATLEPEDISPKKSIKPATAGSGEGELTEWVNDYVKQLQQTRENRTGTSDLLNAEVKLAEALAARKKFESDHNREYRLRAYTGDSLF